MDKYLTGWPGASPKQVAAVRLRHALLKKHADNVSPDADSLALKKFLEVNEGCSKWHMSDTLESWDDQILGEMRIILHRFWYRDGTSTLCDNPLSLLDEGYAGPGASVEAAGYDFYTKFFAGRLTCSSSFLSSLYRFWCLNRANWKDAESSRSSMFGPVALVSHSLLSFVPKTNEISRTICSEPALNGFVQLGLKRMLERRISSVFGIDFATQQNINRELARRGSVDGDLCTIDLSSASDSVSLEVCRYLLPASMFEILLKLRTPNCKLPDGEVVPLHMMSTMGNGFTFPLQTLIFISCILAVYKALDITPRPGPTGNYGVYGDDIICESSCAARVVRLLSLLGFTVNRDKSFVEGLFRESCGADWYAGFPVRGYYLKDQKLLISPYVAYNRLSLWSAEVQIGLPQTLRYLLKCGYFLPVPWSEPDSAGYKITLRSIERPKKDSNGAYRFQRLEVKPHMLFFSEDGVTVPKGERRRVHNPAGAFLTFLGGYMMNGSLVVRRRDGIQAYRRRNAVCPHAWEWTAEGGRNTADLSWLKAARDLCF
jgi:hypothetical protein